MSTSLSSSLMLGAAEYGVGQAVVQGHVKPEIVEVAGLSAMAQAAFLLFPC